MRFKNYIKENTINPEATILEFPEFRQVYSYDCGASALQSIIQYYGIDEQEGMVMKLLGITPEGNGADIPDLIRVAEFYGLDVISKEGLTIIDLVGAINEGYPVLVEIQAFPDDPYDLSWRDSNEFGHYCVAIGYDKYNLYFEDPLSTKRTYLSFKEMEQRWHGYGENDKIYYRWGMICKGVPSFKNNDVMHFE